jgi:Ca-activated chloride channel family protein
MSPSPPIVDSSLSRDPSRGRRGACRALAAAALAAALAAAVPAGAQTPPAAPGRPPAPAREGFAEEISVAWVLVPAVVRDRDGYVLGLDRAAFRVTIDGRPVPVESFDSGAEAPLSLVFLQDLSGSMGGGGKLDASRDALARVLDAARPADELALASFAGGRLRVDVPFTHDPAVLAESMALWDPYGTTALHDAVAWIPEIADEGRHPKRAVVLLTDGIDNASALAPEAARAIVQGARLPVYVFGLGGEGRPTPGTYAQLLEDLARATGGRYFPVGDPGAVGRAVSALLTDLRSQYVLGFSAGVEPKVWRRLEVVVDGRGREVLHRAGYRGGTPEAWGGG